MKNKILVITIFLFSVPFSFSQERKLQFEFISSYQSYKMNDLNRFLTADGTEVSELYGSPKITSGFGLNFGIRYQFPNSIIMGIGVGYQEGSDEQQVPKTFTNIVTGETTKYSVDTQVKASSKQLLLYLGLAIDNLMKWSERESALKRCNFNFGVLGGWSESQLADRNFNTLNYSEGIRLMNHHSQDFVFEPQIQFGYNVFNSRLITKIGVNLGYQVLKTGHIESFAGKDFNLQVQDNYQEVSLDFSGIRLGLIFGIGK